MDIREIMLKEGAGYTRKAPKEIKHGGKNNDIETSNEENSKEDSDNNS
jgi:hypothetical protein